ncbi:hypothetical protein RvY_18919-2 [Ramazzottius varieornatus]|uniref:Uncharacterized protein n=1 Tax=Ramazzottius varieornatus TaxID=947166 RepID=A0A1D1W7R7_RAMVA|nr:hypothetical protein RvY_18919-2 [Ramazzottius varieornatus]
MLMHSRKGIQSSSENLDRFPISLVCKDGRGSGRSRWTMVLTDSDQNRWHRRRFRCHVYGNLGGRIHLSHMHHRGSVTNSGWTGGLPLRSALYVELSVVPLALC